MVVCAIVKPMGQGYRGVCEPRLLLQMGGRARKSCRVQEGLLLCTNTQMPKIGSNADLMIALYVLSLGGTPLYTI